MLHFYVYILRCSDGSYYIGHTDNIEQRISEHKLGRGHGYTTRRLLVEVVFVQEFAERTEALEAEHQLKKWSRKKKEALIAGDFALLQELARNRSDKKEEFVMVRQAHHERDN